MASKIRPPAAEDKLGGSGGEKEKISLAPGVFFPFRSLYKGGTRALENSLFLSN
jgi:hypothetical protein